MTYRHWTAPDRYRLWELKAEGFSRREIAKLLGRTFRAIKHQLETWRHD